MQRALLLLLLVFAITRVFSTELNSDIASVVNVDNVNVNEVVRKLFLQNILNQYYNVKFDDLKSTNSTKCSKQVELLVDGLSNGAMWALKMFDASSKIPSGIMKGHHVDLGMYDECIAIRATDEDGDEIRGRHCMYSAIAKMGQIEIIEVMSICMPAVCEPEQVQIILNRIIEIIQLRIGFDIPISTRKVTCSSVETLKWSAGGIVTLVGFSLLLVFLAISTICDTIIRCFERNFSPNSKIAVISQFSLYTNALRILNTKSTPETLPAIQGLRFFSMCWVILGHEYFMTLFVPSINTLDLITTAHSWNAVYIMSAPFAVDTFFTISGFLMSYIFLKEMSTGRKFNVFDYYIHRYLRLTPAFAAMLLLTIFILPRIGSGAVWDRVMSPSEMSCRKNWWSMLLYVHNYVNKNDQGCLPHTWYLAVEMQFFVISPLILYPLSKKPKIGLVILGIFFIAAVVTPAIISYENQYSSSLFPSSDSGTNMQPATPGFYMESHNRAAAWLIGIFFGYLVFTQKNTPSTKKAIKWIGWVAAFVAFCFCVFSCRKFQAENYEYEAVWETFYVVVSRPLWSFGVAWIIYAAIRDFGGPVTKILSFSIYHPFSRISYCMYMVHLMIQMMKISASRVPRYFSDFSIFDLFLSDFLLCVFFGFLFSLFFESPILVLEKIIKKWSRRKSNELTEELMDERVEKGIVNSSQASR